MVGHRFAVRYQRREVSYSAFRDVWCVVTRVSLCVTGRARTSVIKTVERNRVELDDMILEKR